MGTQTSWLRRLVLLAMGVAIAGVATSARPAGQGGLRRLTLEAHGLIGLSGLDADSKGRLWAVSEHGLALACIQLGDESVDLCGKPVPIRGVPPGLDLEALVIISPDRYVVGAESQTPERESDPVFMLHVGESEAVVTETLDFKYAPWKIKAGKNHGIEGLCYANGRLLVGSEAVSQASGKRYAPVASYDLDRKTWTNYRLRLTSEVGRLASLACRAGADGALEVLAIERQFEVSRVLSFHVLAGQSETELLPKIVADVAKLIPKTPNYEGIAWLADGRVALIADNENDGAGTGTPMLVLQLP